MTISRCLPAFAAALLLCFDLSARATVLPAEPSQKPAAAQSRTQTEVGIQTQPATPIFSLGTISVAPSPQCFAGPAVNSGKPQTSKPRHPVRRSRRVAEPVPLRSYSRA